MVRKQSKCPICGNNEFTLILRKDTLDNYYNLVECHKCSLVFINPLPSQEDLSKYYNKDYSVPQYQQNKVVLKGKKTLKLLKRLGLKKRSKILEIGASHGFFLNEVKKQSFIPYGVELSKKACDNAKKKFSIKIENKLFDKSSHYKKKNFFDVCVMFDVLEHVLDPNLVIGGFSKVLKREGRVVLTIPNIKATEFKLYGRYWGWVSPPAHLYYYSPVTIEKLFNKHDLEVEYIETYQGDNTGNLVFHMYLALRQLVFNSLKHVYGRKKLFEKKNRIGKTMDSNNAKLGKEFTGLSGIIFNLTQLLNPILNIYERKRNKLGRGATILIIGKKK